MNIINIEHISKLFGDKLIFDDASFGLQEGDKVGIVGINGTGKSTLLRMVAGEETPDSGQIIRQNNLKMAYLPQTPEFPKDATVLSYALSGDEEDWQVQSNLVQLGITEYDAKIDTLSGGQRRKVALAKVLASDFDVLILDEPTNHLDNAMLSWLEDYLKNYRGTVFMVTHDRYFLDKVSNRILEISHGKMYSYDSNYSRFLELKAEREEMELASERKRQSILRMELEWAKRGCRARSTKQRARLERLEVLKNGTAPTADAVVEMDAVETRMGKKTIEFHNVSKAFGDKTLMKDFEYIFLRNQSVGIIGPNGCGKSTMLRMITGEVLPDAGTIEIGDTIRISLTDAPEEEAHAGAELLRALGLRSGVQFVSCPSCGRTEYDLIGTAKAVETRLRDKPWNITVAVMGCVVNGPGEASHADYGIAGGKSEGVIFKHGEPVARVASDRLADALVELIERENQ